MVDENCNKIAGPPRSKFPPKREGLKPPQIITDKSKIFDLSDDGDKKLSDDSSKSPPKKKGNVTPEISDHKSRAFDLLDGGVHSKRSYSLKPSTKGMLVSTLFALATFVRPIHILVPFLMILYGGFIFSLKGYLIALVFLLSFFIPPKPAPYLVSGLLSPILDYFQYDEIVENSPIHIQESINDGCQYIYACQPHGIVPFCSIAWSIRQAQQNRKISPTAVAWMVLATPILKHVMGIFGCVTTRQMINELKRKETSSVRLYVGSTAEIFYCTENIEVLELTKRKQFIHLALQMGIDVIPVYMFGNSTLFSVWKHKVLIKISEFVQFPFSYVWGRYGLPIPRQQKVS